MPRAMNGVGPLKPRAMRVIRRVFVLRLSTIPLLSECSDAAVMAPARRTHFGRAA